MGWGLILVWHLHPGLRILHTVPAHMRPNAAVCLPSSVVPWWDPAVVWAAWGALPYEYLAWGPIGSAGSDDGAAQGYQQAMNHHKADQGVSQICN